MAREKPTSAPRWRTALRVVVWMLIAASTTYAALRVHRFVSTDGRFFLPGSVEESENVVIVGLQYASRERVLQAFHSDFGRSIYNIPLAERRRRLLAVDWIEDAAVSRLWPNRLTVRVKERTPVAFLKLPYGRFSSRVILIDREGVLMAPPRRASFRLPVLSGVTQDQPRPERQAGVGLMMRVTGDLGARTKELSEIDVSLPENVIVVVVMGGRGLELWLGNRNFSRRYLGFVENYPEIQKWAGECTVFDLRIDGRVIAKE